MEPASALELLDRLAVGSVAITARAVTHAGMDLTFAQWRVLFIIGEHEHGVTVGEVAARVGSNASPTSRLVGRLRRRGLLVASKDDPDGRVTRIRLSEPGRRLRAAVLDRRRQILAGVLTDAELAVPEIVTVERLAAAFGAFA
jgi:DNA-binding MarR family transcriptional regulator